MIITGKAEGKYGFAPCAFIKGQHVIYAVNGDVREYVLFKEVLCNLNGSTSPRERYFPTDASPEEFIEWCDERDIAWTRSYSGPIGSFIKPHLDTAGKRFEFKLRWL